MKVRMPSVRYDSVLGGNFASASSQRDVDESPDARAGLGVHREQSQRARRVLGAELAEAPVGGVEGDALVVESREPALVALLVLGTGAVAVALEEGLVVAGTVLIGHDAQDRVGEVAVDRHWPRSARTRLGLDRLVAADRAERLQDERAQLRRELALARRRVPAESRELRLEDLADPHGEPRTSCSSGSARSMKPTAPASVPHGVGSSTSPSPAPIVRNWSTLIWLENNRAQLSDSSTARSSASSSSM